ncbi:DUF2321 domain-containing protein [Odoribacter lunatus]|uniref:DUF2321 domain-containing protein n=1 Tax=Odoribacter lunatus TaxID=2941335 RepID=UPI0020402968|nr:DUF2321 domain-containing protein [Odoribacter lunatus]
MNGNKTNAYDVMQICLNGHCMTEHYYSKPYSRKEYCSKCAKKTIIQCPHCKNEIKGNYIVPESISIPSVVVPVICEYCGHPFPWNKEKKEIFNERKQNVDNISLINKICERFPLVVKQLQKRHENRPNFKIDDEYDVQDLFHSLLILFFNDIRVEEPIPSYAGSSKRADFLLKDEQIIIEIKKTRANLKNKQLGDQLIIDIANYKNHPDCKIIYCFVYAPDKYITNPQGLEKDLSKDENIEVIVKIVS